MIKLSKIVWAEHVACMEKKKNAYRVLMEKPEGRSRSRWKENIIIDVKEMTSQNMNRIGLVQYGEKRLAVVNTVMIIQVPQSEGSLLSSSETISFLRQTLHHGISFRKGYGNFLPLGYFNGANTRVQATRIILL
jgi:hypothetical protein